MAAAEPDADAAGDSVVDLVYGSLHRLAERAMAGEREGHTLQPTALVHETWLRLSGELSNAGWDEEKFPQLMLYVAEGYPPLEAFKQVYGDPDELDDAFQRYIRKF